MSLTDNLRNGTGRAIALSVYRAVLTAGVIAIGAAAWNGSHSLTRLEQRVTDVLAQHERQLERHTQRIDAQDDRLRRVEIGSSGRHP